MTKIKLNNSEYQIESYNRTTNISDNNITSTAYLNLSSGEAVNLNSLLGTTINSIEIDVDDIKIYELTNINAKVDSVNEYLSGNRMSYNVNITFKQGE